MTFSLKKTEIPWQPITSIEIITISTFQIDVMHRWNGFKTKFITQIWFQDTNLT